MKYLAMLVFGVAGFMLPACHSTSPAGVCQAAQPASFVIVSATGPFGSPSNPVANCRWVGVITGARHCALVTYATHHPTAYVCP